MKELTELKNEFYEVMYKYEKSFSEEGVMANLTAWQTAKADLLSLLRRHPNWNEDEQAIIFDCNQALSIHPDMVDETAFTLLDIASEMLSGEQLEDFRTALHAAVSGYSCTVSEENLEILRQRGGIATGVEVVDQIIQGLASLLLEPDLRIDLTGRSRQLLGGTVLRRTLYHRCDLQQ